MSELFFALRQEWARSAWFRMLTIAGAAVSLLITLLIGAWQFGLLSADDLFIVDLKFYLDASQRFLGRQALYIAPRPDFGLYAYSPFFALLLTPLTFVKYEFVWLGDMLLHLAAYLVLYWRWFTIFRQYKLERAAETLIRLFPLWLVFTGLLNEVMSQNVYIFMALAGTLLLEAVLEKHVWKSILWLAIILPIKPQWAFALGVPVLLGQWRFLAKIGLGGLAAYLGTIFATSVAAGPGYAIEQYLAHIKFLQTIPQIFFWNTLSAEGHLGYNNSINQIVIFFSNNASYSASLIFGLKMLVLLPLLIALWYFWRTKASASSHQKLAWAFLVYIGAFFYLDVVTELTLAMVILCYLLGTLPERKYKRIAWLVSLPYILSFLWASIFLPLSFALPLHNAIIDPAKFFPVVMLVMLGFYILLLQQIWKQNRDDELALR